MCGRYTIYHTTTDIIDRFSVVDRDFDVSPRYNMAPTDNAPVVYEIEGRRKLAGWRWGLVPSWAGDPSIGQRLINARSETLAEKPSFKNSLARRRCIVPADGLYEWTTMGKERHPLHIRLSGGELFGFAGLWDTWRKGDGAPLHSFTIITVPANSLMAAYHARMPAILRPRDEEMWLDSSFNDGMAAVSVLSPFDPECMTAYMVDKRVNRVGWDNPSCILPVAA
jgi:putative SOS response-associated peptidase YedK